MMFGKVSKLIISFLLFISYAEASVLLDKVVAVVDREIITWSELYKAMSFEYETELRSLSIDEKKEYLNQRQEEFLERLIDVRLQLAEVKRLGISASDMEITAALDDIRGRYGLSMPEFKEALKREGFDFDDYYKRIAEQIVLQKFVQTEIQSKIVVSEEEVDEYLKSHKDEMQLEISYRFLQIKIKKPEDREEEREVKNVIKEIQENIMQGVAFEEIMKNVNGRQVVLYTGDSDYISENDLRKDVLDSLEGLDEGEISMPLDAKDGIFIIKLTSKKLPVTLDTLRDNIRNLLISTKSEKKYRMWSKSLRQRALIDVKL